MPTKHIAYRGDIQIYRAVAVLQVLFYHIGATRPASGFLGVDIFFVISGYLMATLYTIESTPLEFYQRRARRLLPAYFATIALTLIVAFFITIPTDFRQLETQTYFASSLSSNVGFWMQNSYFSKSEFNPLLHLWSLGVECQFYLAFPLLVFAWRKWRPSLPLIAAVSLGLCFAVLLVSPKLSFFMLPMRVWEFAIGMWVASRPVLSEGRRWYGALALAAMVAIPFLPIDGEQRSILFGHPGLGAFAVVIATAVALLCRQPAAVVNSRIGKAVQGVGAISYSLYLVHWPVLVLMHYVPFGGTRSGATSFIDAGAALAMVGIATAVIYLSFERTGPKIFTAPRAALAAIALAVVAPLALLAQSQRFDAEDNRIFAAWTDRAPYRCGKVSRVLHPTETLCQIGDGPRGTVLLIGDSHSDSIKQAFAASASRVGLRTYFAVDNHPLMSPAFDGRWLLAQVRSRHARAVFLHYASGNISPKLVEDARTALAHSNTRLYLIMPTPEYRESVPQGLYLARHGTHPAPVQKDFAAQNAALAHAARASGVAIIDTAPALCTPGCRVADPKGALLYFDDGHLTLTGASKLRLVLDAALQVVSGISR